MINIFLLWRNSVIQNKLFYTLILSIILKHFAIENLLEWILLLLFKLTFNRLRRYWCQRHIVHIVKICIKILPIHISLRNHMKLRRLRPLRNMRRSAWINLMNCLIFTSYSCMNIAYWVYLWIRSTSNVIVIQWALILLVYPLLRLWDLTKVSWKKFLSMS